MSALLDLGEATAIRDVRVLRGDEPGPIVGLLGMLHGNEPAGIGLWRFAEALGRPARGEIHLILGHPDAVARAPGISTGCFWMMPSFERTVSVSTGRITAGC